jgi:ribosomal protein S18 acetylase RimI-like enzyme
MSSPPIIYRQADVHDVPALARIRAAEWGSGEYWQNRISGYMEGELDPQKALKPRIIYMAQAGDEVAGFIAGHLTRRFDCDGELEWINVRAEQRGSGIAAELLRMLAEWFLSQNAPRICVDVSPDNVIARSFYARHGATELKPSWMVWNDVRTACKPHGR